MLINFWTIKCRFPPPPPSVNNIIVNSMQSFSKFEKDALSRLEVIPQHAYSQLQSISLSNSSQRMVLERLFRSMQTPLVQAQLEIRIKDMPNTPEELAASSQRSDIDMERLMKEVIGPHISDMIRQVSKRQ